MSVFEKCVVQCSPLTMKQCIIGCFVVAMGLCIARHDKSGKNPLMYNDVPI